MAAHTNPNGGGMDPRPAPQRRFFMVAGEASGDAHGAALMAAMLQQDKSCRFAGIGGPGMAAAGLSMLYSTDRMAIVGFWEVVWRLPFLWQAMRRSCQRILAWQPERIILIDYPGFNLRLARRMHRAGIPVTYYVSPQLWAWHESRIATIRACVDQLLVIFPFEVEWYRERGVVARFVGHPLLDEPPPELSREAFMQAHDLEPSRPLLTLFPGSRRQELQRHLRLFLTVARLIQAQLPQVQVALGLARGLDAGSLAGIIPGDVRLIQEHPRLALRYCDAALVASGTSTIEAAAWGVPMVVVYRLSPFSWWLGRRVVKIPYVAMVNILAGAEVVPEFLQDRAQPGTLARALLPYFTDQNHRQRVLDKLAQIRSSLQPPGSEPDGQVKAGGTRASSAGASAILHLSGGEPGQRETSRKKAVSD